MPGPLLSVVVAAAVDVVEEEAMIYVTKTNFVWPSWLLVMEVLTRPTPPSM